MNLQFRLKPAGARVGLAQFAASDVSWLSSQAPSGLFTVEVGGRCLMLTTSIC